MTTTTISQGINFTALHNPAFKTNVITVCFSVPLAKETAALNALVPAVLRRRCARYASSIDLNIALGNLYGGGLAFDVRGLGKRQLITMSISTIDDKYVGTDLTRESVALLLDVILRPYFADGAFDEADVAIERQNLIDHIEAEINDKRMFAVRRTVEELFDGVGAGISASGKIEDAEKITPKNLTEAYHNLIKTAGIEIIFTGCGNADKALPLFREAFAPRQTESAALSAVSKRSEIKKITENFDVQQSKLVLGFSLSDIPNSAHAQMFNMVFGAGVSSKLFLNVREKLSLCYYCASHVDRTAGYALVDSGVDTANIEKAKSEILRQLALITENDISEQELLHARAATINALKSIGDNPYATESYYLSRILLGEVESPAEYAEKIMAVTAEDIAKVAKGLEINTLYLLTCKEDAC
jgi:Predicted Zn-dependent peptidases